MRHLVWLLGCALVLSCTVNSSDLAGVDAGGFGTGGHPAGSGGETATGGQPATGGQSATGGQVGTGGEAATGGQIGAGGRFAPGGQNGGGGRNAIGGRGGAGGLATGGQVGTGGQPATGGQTGAAGQGGAAGEAATGGHGGSAGQNGQGGQAGGIQSCTQIQTQYTNAISSAKACSLDTQGECQQLVDTSLSCKGCQVYVNDTSELDMIAASWTAAGCDQMHFVCPAIACVTPQPSRCVAASGTSGGPGPGKSSGTCTAIGTP